MFAHHWIGGEWVDSQKRMESINPANGETIGTYTEAGEAEAARAIAAALKAFRETDWRKNRSLRAKVLNDMADRFEARAEDLVELLALENGKVKPEAQFELSMVPSRIRFNAALALADFGRAMETAHRVFWILDNCSAHRGPKAADRFRAKWPNAILVHTPIHASWLNQIEIYFSIVQRKVLTPNDFSSLTELQQRLLAFQAHYQRCAAPFKWTFTRKNLVALLAKLDRKPLALVA